jgi:16S rRNA (adenine1518-N6/adenine1519-N6)-dimethyltransferase
VTRPRKRFGQHWLRDQKVLQQIVQAAALKPHDRVLEIGPGTGVLTQKLLELAAAVVAVEIDRDLCHQLQKQFASVASFHLIQGDFLALDLAQALADEPQFQQPNKVVANIPYYITGPILEKLLGTLRQPNPHPFESIVLLVQKELADRLYAQSGTKAYGALSVRVQYLADCELICPVPAKAFHPSPKVDSAVIRLHPRPFSLSLQQPKLFDQLVKLGFSQKRKMLRNNLKGLIDRAPLTALLTELHIAPQSRAEDLTVTDWVNLSNRLAAM